MKGNENSGENVGKRVDLPSVGRRPESIKRPRGNFIHEEHDLDGLRQKCRHFTL